MGAETFSRKENPMHSTAILPWKLAPERARPPVLRGGFEAPDYFPFLRHQAPRR